jgi:hypothetical protein
MIFGQTFSSDVNSSFGGKALDTPASILSSYHLPNCHPYLAQDSGVRQDDKATPVCVTI